ncbi:MAG TPA: hypothetical protein VF622_10055 [Segetibacter sp.]
MQYLKYIFLLLVFKSLSASAQKDSLLKVSLITSIQANAVDFTTDNLGNIYVLNATNQIKKLSNKGDSIAVYNDVRRYGKIFSIDATNPLKVLVYYREFATILILDRLLNVRNTIDLRQQNIAQAKLITSSYDNNIWLFDELENKLKKIDDNGRVLLETPDFRQIFEEAISPSIIYDRDGLVYLYDSARALITFDYYGARKNNFKIKGISDLQVMDKNTILGRNKTHIILYKPATLQSFTFKLQSQMQGFKKINFNNSRLYVLTTTGALEIYNMPS